MTRDTVPLNFCGRFKIVVSLLPGPAPFYGANKGVCLSSELDTMPQPLPPPPPLPRVVVGEGVKGWGRLAGRVG